MAKNAYLLIDGIEGECTVPEHEGWIEIIEMEHEVQQAASRSKSSAGGLTGERTDHADFVIKKEMDKTTPKLYEHCSTGKTIPFAEVSLKRAAGGEDKVEYMHYKFSPILITSVSTEFEDDAVLPTEVVTFTYQQVEWKYTQQKQADGTPGGVVATGYTLKKDAKV